MVTKIGFFKNLISYFFVTQPDRTLGMNRCGYLAIVIFCIEIQTDSVSSFLFSTHGGEATCMPDVLLVFSHTQGESGTGIETIIGNHMSTMCEHSGDLSITRKVLTF